MATNGVKSASRNGCCFLVRFGDVCWSVFMLSMDESKSSRLKSEVIYKSLNCSKVLRMSYASFFPSSL